MTIEATSATRPTSTRLTDLPTTSVSIDVHTRMQVLKDEFDRRIDLPGVILTEDGNLFGVLSRDALFRHFSRAFFREVFIGKSIREFAEMWCRQGLRLPAETTIHQAAELALGRPHEEAYDPILVDYGAGRYGVLDTHALLVAQSQLLSLSKALEEQKDKAEAANRAKTEFLANISHELRTPLHGILSYAQFGAADADSAERDELKSFFTSVESSAQTLLNLVNDLLDLAKLEAGKMQFHLQPADIDLLVDAVVDEFNSTCAHKGIRVVYQRPDQGIVMDVDPERIKQVLRNLLSNAVKFSPKEGRIWVRLRQVRESVLVSVRDEGPGIPAEELEKVFDKFVQSSKTKTGQGGTGLGLAICWEIVDGHGGRIWAENASAVGCVFYCELPLKAPAGDDAELPLDEYELAR
jgi:signal transduction histidine kinase